MSQVLSLTEHVLLFLLHSPLCVAPFVLCCLLCCVLCCQRISHGLLDVNRLAVMPQQPNIIATACDQPEVRKEKEKGILQRWCDYTCKQAAEPAGLFVAVYSTTASNCLPARNCISSSNCSRWLRPAVGVHVAQLTGMRLCLLCAGVSV